MLNLCGKKAHAQTHSQAHAQMPRFPNTRIIGHEKDLRISDNSCRQGIRGGLSVKESGTNLSLRSSGNKLME